MKKLVIIGMSVMLLIGFSITAVAAEELKIAIMSDIQADEPWPNVMREIFAEFGKLYPDLKVDIETVVWDQIDTKLMMTVKAGNPPDLSWFSGQKLKAQLNAGSLMPLDDLMARDMTEEEINDFASVDRDTCTSVLDGKRYGFLTSVHSRLLWYRKDLIPEPPKTWDDLVEIAQKINDPENKFWGYVFYAGRHYRTAEEDLSPYVWSNGGRYSDETGRAAYNTPEVAEAIQLLSDMVNKYKVSPPGVVSMEVSDIWDSFLAGNYGMYIAGTYQLSSAKESELWKEDKIGVALNPSPKGDTPRNFANGWALGIPNGAKNPEAAWKFLQFFTSPEIQVKHAIVEGGMPIRRSAWTDEVFQNPVHQKFIENIDKAGHPMDPLIYYGECLDSIAIAFQDYLLHPDKDLTELLDDAAKKFNKRYYGD